MTGLNDGSTGDQKGRPHHVKWTIRQCESYYDAQYRLREIVLLLVLHAQARIRSCLDLHVGLNTYFLAYLHIDQEVFASFNIVIATLKASYGTIQLQA